MSRVTRYSVAAANAAVDAIASRLSGGTLCIYDGTMPARPDDEIRDQRLLCEIKLAAPAFEPAVGGVALIKPVEGRNVAAGLAAWYRFKGADGAAVTDGNMASEGASLNIGMPQLPEHALIRIENFALAITNVPR